MRTLLPIVPLLALALFACHPAGSAERAGKSLDKTGESISDALNGTGAKRGPEDRQSGRELAQRYPPRRAPPPGGRLRQDMFGSWRTAQRVLDAC